MLEKDSAAAHLRHHALTPTEYENQHGAPVTVTTDDSPAVVQSDQSTVQSIPVNEFNSPEKQSLQNKDVHEVSQISTYFQSNIQADSPINCGDMGTPVVPIPLEITQSFTGIIILVMHSGFYKQYLS